MDYPPLPGWRLVTDWPASPLPLLVLHLIEEHRNDLMILHRLDVAVGPS
jgi:hypothetical protein